MPFDPGMSTWSQLTPAVAERLEKYFEQLAPIVSRHEPPERYYALAEEYGLTITNEWIDELEQTYGVKL
jgi:hypothetical protein